MPVNDLPTALSEMLLKQNNVSHGFWRQKTVTLCLGVGRHSGHTLRAPTPCSEQLVLTSPSQQGTPGHLSTTSTHAKRGRNWLLTERTALDRTTKQKAA